MEELRKMLYSLCALSGVSGYEGKSKEELIKIAAPFFDEYYSDSFGSCVFVKKSNTANAPRLMIDAHFDEVGMMVSKLHEGGFLSVVPIGGLDSKVLPASEVTVYGKKEIYGIISSVPPHLKGLVDTAVPQVSDLYIDTGYPLNELEKLVSVGDVVGFKAAPVALGGDFVASKGLDNRACVCALLDMAKRIETSRLEFDVYIVISAQEETGKNGARLIANKIKPDIAIVTDVNFARGEGIDETESIECLKGASVDISSLTDRTLTKNIMRMLECKKIPYQKICEPFYTYTNSDGVSISACGIRTALLSVPIKSMHTPKEAVSLSDIRSLSDILLEIAYTKEINL